MFQYSNSAGESHARLPSLAQKVRAAIAARHQRNLILRQELKDLEALVAELPPRPVSPGERAAIDELERALEELVPACKIATSERCEIATSSRLEKRDIPESFQNVDAAPVIGLSSRAANTPLDTHNSSPTRPPQPQCKSSPSQPVNQVHVAPHNRSCMSWRKASAEDKFVKSIEVAARHGGLCLSLNFNIGREGTLLNVVDPVRLISGYIAREMRRQFGFALPHSFSLEFSPGEGKLHLHGVVVPVDSSPGHIDSLKRVLRRAAGLVSGRAGARQCSLMSFSDDRGGPHGWAGYITKSISRTRDFLGVDRITFISSDLLRSTKQEWTD